MSKYLKLAFIAVAFITLNACDKSDPGRPMQPEGKVIAKVNSVELTQPELDNLLEARRAAGQAANRDNTLEELIGLELLRQEAAANDLHLDPQIAAEINRQAASTLVSKLINDKMTENPVTDEDVAAEYARQVEARPDKEYKSSHILVQTEDEGKAIIAELDAGADFAEVAKAKSTGPSGKSGGSLGWSSPSSYVPEFAMALQSIEVGQYSKQPVKTQFGWHIILVEDMREANKPTLEQVKPQLQRIMMSQRINDYVTGLREKASVNLIEEEPVPVEEPAAEEPAPAIEEEVAPPAEESSAATEESTAEE